MKKMIHPPVRKNSGVFKILFFMRLTLICIVLAVLGVQANTYSQNTRFNFKYKSTSIKQIIDDIKSQSEFEFFYSNDDFDTSAKIDLQINNATVEEVLQKIVDPISMKYKVIDKTVVISNVTTKDLNGQQQKSISGKVTDSSGASLPGVSVVVKGTTNGTISDSNGKYILSNIPENATVQFSFVGMKAQEVLVGNKNIINIILLEETIGIEEVVTVGYSSKRLSELSSSVSVVNEKKLQAGVTSGDLGTMLQGKVPGLVVSNNSGHPQSGNNLVIRGVGSIGAGYSPLLVVDGIIGGSAYPSDIVSITVLKDAAATGLYGSRASNGVILITTKSGSSGETKVSYDGSFGLSFNRKGNLDLMNSKELYENRRLAGQNYYNDRIAAKDPNFINRTFDAYFGALVPSSVLDTDTDWQSLLTRTGQVNKHNISVSGGDKKTTFFVSANIYSEKGTLVSEDYQNINIRANLSHQITDKLSLTWRMNGGTKQYPNDPQSGQESVPVQYYINMPWDPAYEKDGVTPYNPYTSGYWYANNKSNYFYDKQHYSDRTKELNFNTDLKLQYMITDFMSFSSSNRVGFWGSDWKQLLDSKHALANFENGRLSQTYTYSYSLMTSNLLTLKHAFGKHNLSGIFGQEYSYEQQSNTNAVGIDIPIGLSAISATGRPKSIAGTELKTGFESYFSQIDYNHDNRYFLVGSVRSDASSRFGANNRWGTFFTLGASWMINKEKFLRDVSWIDLLKFKLSYGATGNANISDYLSLGTYSFATQNTYNGNSGTRPARMENPDLTWEKAYTTNLGLEFAILKRVKFDIDFYNRENRDLLQNVPLSAATGFSSQQRNVGSVRNRGIDINLNTVNLDGNFRWETNINLNINRNQVLSLNNHEDISNGSMRIREGLPMKYFYMKDWAGVDVQTGDPLWIRWEDANGNIIHGADKKEPAKVLTTNDYNKASNLFITSSYPSLTGGIQNDFYYKNFSLSIFCNYVVGQTINNDQRRMMDDDGTVLSKNQMNLFKGWTRWEKPGDIATHPRLLLGGNKNSFQSSSRWLEDGSYFRIQNVNFSYTFPNVFSGLKIYAGIDNLAVFSKYSGTDPDVNMENPVSDQSKFGESYGAARKLLFGVKVNF